MEKIEHISSTESKNRDAGTVREIIIVKKGRFK